MKLWNQTPISGRPRNGKHNFLDGCGRVSVSRRAGAGLVILIGLGVAAVFWIQHRFTDRSNQSAPTTASRELSTLFKTPAQMPLDSDPASLPGMAELGHRNVVEPDGKESAQPTDITAPEPSPLTRQWVASLCTLLLSTNRLAPEQVIEWKQACQNLARAGSAAIPAIREFLAKHTDICLTPEDAQRLGHASVRSALFHVLAQIGGPEAVATSLQTLRETAEPREVALLAQCLEKMEPEQHRSEALAAARASLSMAASGKMPDKDVAPLFEVLQKYGDANATVEMEQAAGHWNYYAMIALAQLPEGAGIPSLIRIVQGQDGVGSGLRNPALEMLAMAASTSDQAKAALLDEVRHNKLTPYNWATLGPIWSGEQVGFLNSAFEESPVSSNVTAVRISRIDNGNQAIYRAPMADQMTPERIRQQLAFVDELLAATKDPAAIQSLQQSKAQLDKRQSRPDPSH